jgi:hypothetical protein
LDHPFDLAVQATMREAIRPELRTNSYAPQPVRQVRIAKADKPGEWRTLIARRD